MSRNLITLAMLALSFFGLVILLTTPYPAGFAQARKEFLDNFDHRQ